MRYASDDLKERMAFYNREISIRGFPFQFLEWITRDGLEAEYALSEYIRDFGFYEVTVNPTEYDKLIGNVIFTDYCCKDKVLMLLWAFYFTEER